MLRISKIVILILSIQFKILPLLASEPLLIQSTTSTKNSGFFDYILPIIHAETGILANVVAVGTGAAINNVKNCNGDLLIVHAKNREKNFVKGGFGIKRYDLMYNDFIIIGPSSDPANIREFAKIESVFKKIAAGSYKFTSRGDDSGTNIRELELWRSSKIKPQKFSGVWYLETGSGMGTTLNIGIELNSYILVDRATWITFRNKQDHKILFEGDEALFNQYGIIAVNPENCPDAKFSKANVLIKWLISPEGQSKISDLKINGEQLFFPNSN